MLCTILSVFRDSGNLVKHMKEKHSNSFVPESLYGGCNPLTASTLILFAFDGLDKTGDLFPSKAQNSAQNVDRKRVTVPRVPYDFLIGSWLETF